jgi:hypothetical protein
MKNRYLMLESKKKSRDATRKRVLESRQNTVVEEAPKKIKPEEITLTNRASRLLNMTKGS